MNGLYDLAPADCPNAASHRGPQGPNEDIAVCPRCGSLTYAMRPEGETFGLHTDDCSLPVRHEGHCQPDGEGHAPAATVRGYWPELERGNDPVTAAQSSPGPAGVGEPVEPVQARRSEPEMVRRAKVRLAPSELQQLIGLPEGLEVRAIYPTWDPAGIFVVVEGESLPEIPEGSEAPWIGGFWNREAIVGPDGRLYVRFGWEPEVAPTAPGGDASGRPSGAPASAETGAQVGREGSDGVRGPLSAADGDRA